MGPSQQTQSLRYRARKPRGPAVQHREPPPVSGIRHSGREDADSTDRQITESLCCAEAVSQLYFN